MQLVFIHDTALRQHSSTLPRWRPHVDSRDAGPGSGYKGSAHICDTLASYESVISQQVKACVHLQVA